MKSYIITGGAGFIGSNLAAKLIREGNRVHIFDDLSTGFRRNIPEEAIFHKVDISDSKRLATIKIPDEVAAIFHLAAQSSGEASFDNPLRDIDVNYKGTYNLLELARTNNIKRFLFASSMSVYGNVESDDGASEKHACSPISYYGCNKLASERMIEMFSAIHNLDFTIFRLFSVYGPGQNMSNMKQGIVSIYLSFLMKDQPIHVKGSLDRCRDFIYVDDVVEILIRALKSKKTHGEIINAGSGIKTSVKKLITALLTEYDRNDFSKWVKISGQTLGDVQGFAADIAKLETLLNWSPRNSVADGVRKMKTWVDSHVNLWEATSS